MGAAGRLLQGRRLQGQGQEQGQEPAVPRWAGLQKGARFYVVWKTYSP